MLLFYLFIFITSKLGNKSEFESYLKNSDLQIEALFVSHYSEAFDYLFKDYIKKQKHLNHSIDIKNTLNTIANKEDSQIQIKKNGLI